jgi:hypothetical protein
MQKLFWVITSSSILCGNGNDSRLARYSSESLSCITVLSWLDAWVDCASSVTPSLISFFYIVSCLNSINFTSRR